MRTFAILLCLFSDLTTMILLILEITTFKMLHWSSFTAYPLAMFLHIIIRKFTQHVKNKKNRNKNCFGPVKCSLFDQKSMKCNTESTGSLLCTKINKLTGVKIIILTCCFANIFYKLQIILYNFIVEFLFV